MDTHIENKSYDLRFMELMPKAPIYIKPGESLSRNDLDWRIKMDPMLCEEPDLQELLYLLRVSTIKGITKTLGSGWQYHFLTDDL